MKLPQPPESTPGEYEGRTAIEAVRRARRDLGPDAPIRCWKTRRGGLLGFFAKETFVASIAPPAGAVTPVKMGRAKVASKKGGCPPARPRRPTGR